MKFIKINNKIININNIIKLEYDDVLSKYAICLVGEKPILISKRQYDKILDVISYNIIDLNIV